MMLLHLMEGRLVCVSFVSKKETKLLNYRNEEKQMKKISFIMVIVLVCGICLSACNASGNEPTEDANLEQPTTQESSKIEVKDIFLSKAELSLGLGESSTLIATKSPGNAPSELVWSSQNPEIASVDNNGTVMGVAEGDTVIKVEADNGIIAVCNVQ